MRTLLLSALTLFLVATVHTQSPPRSLAELEKLGPQVGQRVPDFALLDQRGQTRDLESLLGPNGALLVFFRSAGW